MKTIINIAVSMVFCYIIMILILFGARVFEIYFGETYRDIFLISSMFISVISITYGLCISDKK